jgi:hypothetical protein
MVVNEDFIEKVKPFLVLNRKWNNRRMWKEVEDGTSNCEIKILRDDPEKRFHKFYG